MLAQILEDGARAAILAAQLGEVEYIPMEESCKLFEKEKLRAIAPVFAVFHML